MLLPVGLVIELQSRPAFIRIRGERGMTVRKAVELPLVTGLALLVAHAAQIEIAAKAAIANAAQCPQNLSTNIAIGADAFATVCSGMA